MPIVLHANNPAQVASASSIEALVGEPAKRLLILSGIAIPNFWTNHDEETRSDEVVVRLGVFVSSVDRSAVHVGLAHIANDETAFAFGVNANQLEVEAGTGELLLRVWVTALGEETLIRRFGYHVVAHVRMVAARISGTIALPKSVLDVSRMSPTEVASLFRITANTQETVNPPPPSFSYFKYTPVATGQTQTVRDSPETSYIDYKIDGCPFNVALYVDVALQGRLAAVGGVGVGQTAGPRPVVLTNVQPDASGVDFGVGRIAGPR
jgi:hypothetical protein